LPIHRHLPLTPAASGRSPLFESRSTLSDYPTQSMIEKQTQVGTINVGSLYVAG
jgi:hypothetical protein